MQLFDNYKDEIAYEAEYFQDSPDEMDPIEHFMKQLNEHIIPEIIAPSMMEPKKPLNLTPNEEIEFEKSRHCYACNCELKNGEAMRDHW